MDKPLIYYNFIPDSTLVFATTGLQGGGAIMGESGITPHHSAMPGVSMQGGTNPTANGDIAGTNNNQSKLTVDALLSMTPVFSGIDLVSAAARQLLVSHVRSQKNVHGIFFPNHKQCKFEDRLDPSWFDFEFFACLYICQAICKNKDPYDIHTMIDENRIDSLLTEVYRSPEWKKAGFAMYTMLFAELVKDEETHIPFSDYLKSDRRKWANLLSKRVRDTKWVYSVIRPVVRGQYTDTEYNRDLNILFIKLHLLDPTMVMPTFHYLNKALPDLNLELATTNYLGGPLDWMHIREEVDLAINKASYPANASRLSMEDIDLYYGVQATEFILLDIKELGLWTGKYPDNKRTSQFRDRCSIM